MQGLAVERMNQRLKGHATDESIDYVEVGDVGELIALF
jgi:hypothetical protein